MNKDDTNSQTNVVISVEEEDDLFLATNDKVIKTRWVMDFVASKHICRDREMLDTLKTDGEFDNFKLGNGGKIKVEGIGSMRMKLYDGAIRSFSNVKFVSSIVVKKKVSLCENVVILLRREKIHMTRECVRREIVKQSHFIERKVSLCESVIISCNYWVGYSGL